MRSTSALYFFGRFICRSFFKLGWRLNVSGTQNIPQHGPAIIASNHRSYADPPLVGVGISRVVHFLAKKELFDFKPFGWLIAKLNAHPINRASGIAALRAAQDILEEEGVVILFPEGRRSDTDDLQDFKAGVGMLAIKTQVPIVPTYIHNSGHFFELKKISVIFGTPLDPQKFSSYDNLAQEVRGSIQKLKDQAQ